MTDLCDCSIDFPDIIKFVLKFSFVLSKRPELEVLDFEIMKSPFRKAIPLLLSLCSFLLIQFVSGTGAVQYL